MPVVSAQPAIPLPAFQALQPNAVQTQLPIFQALQKPTTTQPVQPASQPSTQASRLKSLLASQPVPQKGIKINRTPNSNIETPVETVSALAPFQTLVREDSFGESEGMQVEEPSNFALSGKLTF